MDDEGENGLGKRWMDTINQYITDLDAELSLNSKVVFLEQYFLWSFLYRTIIPSEGTLFSILHYKQWKWD